MAEACVECGVDISGPNAACRCEYKGCGHVSCWKCGAKHIELHRPEPGFVRTALPAHTTGGLCFSCHLRFTGARFSRCGLCEWRGCIVCYWKRHRKVHPELVKEDEEVPVIVKGTGGSDFQPAPTGAHAAVCCDVRDLGLVTSTYNGKEKTQQKVLLSWLINELRDDGKHYMVAQRFTASLHEKASLRKFLESWRGRPFTEKELEGFDVETLIGAPCLLNVIHETKGGRTYANIASIMRLPKGMESPKIPADFVRYQDRPAAKAQDDAPAHDDADAPAEVDDEVPF
jgi:hypothetical protein